MFSKSPKNGNVLSEIESQGKENEGLRLRVFLKMMQYTSGNMYQRLKDTSSRNSASAE
jgi:hypothetical protein